MRPLLLAAALFAFASTSALAGGSGPPPPKDDFIQTPFSLMQFVGPSVPFRLNVDTTKTHQFRDYLPGPRILITAFSTQGWIVMIDSRPLRPGEKLHWEGKLPAKGKWVIRVVDANGNGISSGGDLPDMAELQQYGVKEYTFQVATDARGGINTR